MKSYKVLLVDDDIEICQMIKKALDPENIETLTISTGREARNVINSQAFDLIILDIMLDDTDGFQLLKKIQAEDIEIPVIFLSGKQQDYDKILALGMGADDYITKPFSMSVLIAKIKAHLRRSDKIKELQTSSRKITKAPFVLNIDTYQLFKDGEEIFLSSKEIMLMKFFMENPNRVFTKEQLYEKVWNNTIIDNNSIMVYIRHLRKKIEDDSKNPEYIQTVWGIGYKFNI
ncbi:response regulator transcription factor [Ilyobacter polytropus]|uniref:Two component transcriptional regulator, winged helix family n=1 Tax=Ilyobacter polytropus (strain ATCC 51220 / DSM 2926 / LMG 16218 / CuHBu1) TaxID=572544 RepID=E3HAQ6_ILYPC|nr:response regulator transcription factor [Ilyobacter polytropus]ADO82057.1 two component transcriptional regulator, winged helix family [Ilyobacter polytropus DSM 2926]